MNRGDVWQLDLGGAPDGGHIQTVAKARFVKYIGALDSSTMRTIGRKLILALGLEDSV